MTKHVSGGKPEFEIVVCLSGRRLNLDTISSDCFPTPWDSRQFFYASDQ